MSGKVEQTVVLGVTGCIAAYKACELARLLIRDGFRVKVVMTEAATHFVGPLTLRTLTDQPVATSLWDDPAEAPVHHISLAEEADAMVVAPATANVIAKIAVGRADDILTTTALATEATLVIAPAMNTHMWRDEATQANLAVLRSRGAVIVEPDSGDLACGDVGEGRLADLDRIADATRVELARTRRLAGLKMLVTAGPTYEPIDPVRYIGNRSSGKTGFWIAEEAARRGAEVTLVTGPSSLRDPFGVDVVRVGTALEMHGAAMAVFEDVDVVVASAAVSDFRPATTYSAKAKKSDAPQNIELARNPDILAEMGAKKGLRLLVGFAAETENVLAHARAKMESKNLDMVVANDVSRPDAGFASDSNSVMLVTVDGEESLPLQHKRSIASLLLDRLADLWESSRE